MTTIALCINFDDCMSCSFLLDKCTSVCVADHMSVCVCVCVHACVRLYTDLLAHVYTQG